MARRATAPAREAELAARWATGVRRGATLRTLSGATYHLIFEGRRNGGPGPDFRDAALEMEAGARLLGDIELHLRARDWLAHGHHTDNRYNRVMLRVALDAADAFSPLASGGAAPIVYLSFTQATPLAPPLWPCADLHTRIGPVATRTLLLCAGSARFERRVHAFADALTSAIPDASESGSATCAQIGWSAADQLLWVALAEAIGYGQHREALRAAGMRLLSGSSLDSNAASRSERRRLNGLLALWERWRDGTVAAIARCADGRAENDYCGAARLRWRDLASSCAHHGGERRLPLRCGLGDCIWRRRAGRPRAYGVSRTAWLTVESDHS